MKPVSLASLIVLGFLVAMGLLGGSCYVIPKYHVWEQHQKGMAELARAESNRKIAIQEAEARKASATLLAEAEVARARGVAQSNEIIGEGLKGHEEYLRYLWIMSLEHADGATIVYVPTETNLPILEANRFK